MIITLRKQDMATVKRGVPDGAIIGVTSGCFDLLHNLHLNYLERCARMCDFLIVGVDSDDLVRATKGPNRPNIPEMQRVQMVNALSCVGAAFVMGSVRDFATMVKAVDARVVFKNYAFVGRKVHGVGGRTKLVIVPDVDFPTSTSQIVDRIVLRSQAAPAKK